MSADRLPEPPYYAVIFSAQRTEGDNGYAETAARMDELVRRAPGFIAYESARGADGFGVTIAYFESEEAIRNWKQHSEHLEAQHRGRAKWYENYIVRVAKVERAYTMKDSELGGQ